MLIVALRLRNVKELWPKSKLYCLKILQIALKHVPIKGNDTFPLMEVLKHANCCSLPS